LLRKSDEPSRYHEWYTLHDRNFEEENMFGKTANVKRQNKPWHKLQHEYWLWQSTTKSHSSYTNMFTNNKRYVCLTWRSFYYFKESQCGDEGERIEVPGIYITESNNGSMPQSTAADPFNSRYVSDIRVHQRLLFLFI